MRWSLVAAFVLVPQTLCCCSWAPRDEAPAAPRGALAGPGLRRLSAAELERAASRLLGKPLGLGARLPPDARQHDFSRNVDAGVDALSLRLLYEATETATSNLDVRALPVATQLDQLTRAALGRSPTPEEAVALESLFDLGNQDGDFAAGIALVLRALVGSSGFLYEGALGASSAHSHTPIRLSPGELATALALLIAGEPPDEELLVASERGDLNDGAGRRAQAARLLQHGQARLVYERFVDEWLGVYRVSGLAKAAEVEPHFPALAGEILAEAHALVDDSLVRDHGRLETLLQGFGPHAGLLQQRAFLSTFAHERDSAPVLRGKAVLERLLCRSLPTPAELGIEVTLPEPDSALTTRERFERHATDATCRTCHQTLDGVGFTFEGFDAVGLPRTEEAGKPVDTSGSLVLDGATIPLADSRELSRVLAGSQEARCCAARQVVRFALGGTVPAVEDDFLASLSQSPAASQGAILELFVAFVESDAFAWRGGGQ